MTTFVKFDPEVDDYIPVISNARGRYIDFVMRGDNKFGAFYNTGIFMIHNKNTNPILRISNVQQLHEDRYLERLFEICDSSPKYFSDYPERRAIIDYSDQKHGETIRAILDDEILTDLSKLATIISYIVFFDDVSTGAILSAARDQIPAENAEVINFSTLKNFLIPDFIVTATEKSVASRNRGDGHNYRLYSTPMESSFLDFLKLSKFVSTVENPDETFEDFKLSTADKTLIPITTDVVDFVKQSNSFINSIRGNLEKFKNSSRKEARRLVTFASLALNTEFVEDLQVNQRDGVCIARDELMSSILTEHEKNLLRRDLKVVSNWKVLSNFLSVDEIHSISEVFRKSPLADYFYLDNHMGLFMANIYIYLGSAKLEEFILYIINREEYESTLQGSYGPSGKVKESYRDLYLKLLEDDFAGYPVSWVAELV